MPPPFTAPYKTSLFFSSILVAIPFFLEMVLERSSFLYLQNLRRSIYPLSPLHVFVCPFLPPSHLGGVGEIRPCPVNRVVQIRGIEFTLLLPSPLFLTFLISPPLLPYNVNFPSPLVYG